MTLPELRRFPSHGLDAFPVHALLPHDLGAVVVGVPPLLLPLHLRHELRVRPTLLPEGLLREPAQRLPLRIIIINHIIEGRERTVGRKERTSHHRGASVHELVMMRASSRKRSHKRQRGARGAAPMAFSSWFGPPVSLHIFPGVSHAQQMEINRGVAHPPFARDPSGRGSRR